MRKKFELKYEKYALSNGLEVILHEDHSNPVVAVAIQYHVGSNRERKGKTGFAHLFEHLMFQRSEHLKRNEFFSKISDLGGNFNGGTWDDGTIYYETVPNDALEKILWMESDRMGFFINTVTDAGIQREKDIVINEKRQSYDNQPYGHTEEVMRRALYPANHPYNWTTIGEMDDIRSATTQDVKDFYYKWYQPNNATIAISGDFNVEKTKELVEKYFGEIKSHSVNEKNNVMIPVLDKEIKLVYEDKYANLPELNITFPSPEQYCKESYALDFMCSLLSVGKKTPLYKEIIEKQLAPDMVMQSYSREICGETTIRVRTYPNVNLNDVYDAIKRAFATFENTPVDANELLRIKKSYELQFYQEFKSNLYIAMTLAQTNVFAGSPDVVYKELDIIRSLTKEDVVNVYNKYIKDKPFVATSFVPVGQTDLALNGSIPADVKEEAIESQEVNSAPGEIVDDDYPFSPSSFDRNIEPELGDLHKINFPTIWTDKLSNGINIYGITRSRLPLAAFSFVIKAGSNDCDPDKAGASYLMAKLLNEGTADKTPEELEDAFKNYGTELIVNSTNDSIAFTLVSLSEDMPALVNLLNEVLTRPRWDENEFQRIKNETLAVIQQDLADPVRLGKNAFNKAILGDNVGSMPFYGSLETVSKLTVNDLKDFYDKYVSPSNCDFIIAGDVDKQQVADAFKNFKWQSKDVAVTHIPDFKQTDKVIIPVHYPDAKQSFIMVGQMAMPRNHADYVPAYVANYKLGDGSGGKLFKVLRLEYGYTYGAYSFLINCKYFGLLRGYANVQSSVTQESIDLFREIISQYGKTYTEQDLIETKIAIKRKESRGYETLNALLNVLVYLSVMNLPLDYIEKEIQTLDNLTLQQVLDAIDKYINIDNMKFIVVGDNKIIDNLK